MHVSFAGNEFQMPKVEPSQSVEGFWTVVRGGEVLMITRSRSEADAVCLRMTRDLLAELVGGCAVGLSPPHA